MAEVDAANPPLKKNLKGLGDNEDEGTGDANRRTNQTLLDVQCAPQAASSWRAGA